MSTNTVADAIATKAAAVSGVRGGSARQPEALPASPWVVVGDHAGEVEGPMGQEKLTMRFPLRYYVERRDDDATRAALNDLLDGVIAAFRSGITLSGQVTRVAIATWNTDLFTVIGGVEYQILEVALIAKVTSAQTYSA